MWRDHIKAIPEPNAIDWLNLGMAEDRAGDWAAAELAFLEAVRDRPEFLAAWVGLGLVRVKRDNLLGARAALDQGRVVDPAHPGLQQLEDLINAAEK
jgi:tetratricopeptide (TPR) repeat protein